MTDLAEVKTVSDDDFQEEVSMVVGQANSITISNQQEYDLSEEFLKTTKTLIKGIKDFFEPMRKAADEAKKAILTRKNDALNPVEEADTIVRRKRQVFRDEQEANRRIEQAKAERIAAREAEVERKRLLKQAEKAKKPETVERLEEKAEEVYAKPVFVKPQIETGSVRKDIKITITDEYDFIKAVVRHEIPMTCVEIKIGKVKSWAKACGKKGMVVPGLFIEETTIDNVRG